MKLHEYQAKAILSQYGVPVPRGKVASSLEEAAEVARSLGDRVVVKAQVHAGGRGKAGGIKLANGPEEAGKFAEGLLGNRLITRQTGPEGVPVDKALVEEAGDIARELYVSITIDRAFHGPVLIATPAGGMEVEELAATSPEIIHKEGIDISLGLMPYQARRVAGFLQLTPEQTRLFSELLISMYSAFVEKDCSLVEINPLAVLKDGRLVALDAKVNIDDDALFRHPELGELYDPRQEDELDRQAAEHKIAYVRLDGDVGCLVNGAGLAMATLDLVQATGSSPANFLDVGGAADEQKVTQAFNIILADKGVKRVFVNVFGGILRCDIVARGIIEACRGKQGVPPILVRMQGTNAKEGREILESSGLKVVFAQSLAEAAEKVNSLSSQL